MNVNMPNKKGYTAIGQAVHQLHRTCIERILKHPSADRLHLDYCPGDREFTVREIILEIYSELQPLLPAPLMEGPESSNIHKKNYLLHFSVINMKFFLNISVKLTLGTMKFITPLY